MKTGDKCKILKIYMGEDTKYRGRKLYTALMFKLKKMGIAGVTVVRGIEGYGKGKSVRSTRILDLSSNLPIVIEIIDTAEQIEKAIIVAQEMVKEGLIITSDIDVIRYGRDE